MISKKLRWTFQEFDMDQQQVQAFHQAIWNNEHLEPFYAATALESAAKLQKWKGIQKVLLYDPKIYKWSGKTKCLFSL